MRATSKFLLLGAFAMCLSACLPEPPMGSDSAIFKRPSRYGWGGQWGGQGPRPGNEPPAPPAPQQQARNTNRFGHSDNPGRSSGSSRSQNSGSAGNSRSSGNSRTPDSSPDSNSRSVDSNSSNSGSSSTNSISGGGSSDNKMTNSGGGSSTDTGGTSAGNSSAGSANTPPSNLNSYPYGRLVPGKKGYVTLPGANASVGEVNVEGIKPGTAVEIDDPRDASKKIYFRVP